MTFSASTPACSFSHMTEVGSGSLTCRKNVRSPGSPTVPTTKRMGCEKVNIRRATGSTLLRSPAAHDRVGAFRLVYALGESFPCH